MHQQAARADVQKTVELFRGSDKPGATHHHCAVFLRCDLCPLFSYSPVPPPAPHQELITQAGLDPMLDESHQERLRQYAQVSLQGELLERGWCRLVPQLLESSEHDYREKVMEEEMTGRLH